MDRSRSKYFNTAVKMDEALIALLNEKDFEYITVKEICQRADVNRSTFYLHYENTRDLLEESVKHLLDQFLSYFPVDTQRITERFQNCTLEELNYISEEYLIPYLSYIRDNRRVFSIALKNAGNFGFDSIYQQMFQHIFQPILTRFRFPETEQPYIMVFYLNGIHAIVRQWLRTNCADSTESICSIIQKCILGDQTVPTFPK